MAKLEADADKMHNYSRLLDAGLKIPYRFEVSSSVGAIRGKYGDIEPGRNTGETHSVAGTVQGVRKFGRLTFLDLYDGIDRVQIMARKDELGDKYGMIQHFEVGDAIGVQGTVLKTKTGELSILTKDFTLLSKSLLPIPVLKGSNDLSAERQYRQRYLYWKANPQSREVVYKRARAIDAMRRFLTDRGFVEVDIPSIQPVYGGANARPFTTDVNALDQTWYLSISPELYLKRFIIGGIPRVFYIGKNFRNEGIDSTHNPEFTSMESYAAYQDLYGVMRMTEEMMARVAEQTTGKMKVTYNGKEIDFTPPWRRQTMEDAVSEYLGETVPEDEGRLRALLGSRDISVMRFNRPNAIGALFEHFADKHPVQPTFIHDYPKDSSPLTREHREKEGWVERFEAFVHGMEMANAYSELVDPFEQQDRFEQQEEERRSGNEEAHPTDSDFIQALMYGMPPTGGLGVGIDRLIMILTDSSSIKDVIGFPMSRRED